MKYLKLYEDIIKWYSKGYTTIDPTYGDGVKRDPIKKMELNILSKENTKDFEYYLSDSADIKNFKWSDVKYIVRVRFEDVEKFKKLCESKFEIRFFNLDKYELNTFEYCGIFSTAIGRTSREACLENPNRIVINFDNLIF